MNPSNAGTKPSFIARIFWLLERRKVFRHSPTVPLPIIIHGTEALELSDILIHAKRRIEFLMKHMGIHGSDLIHCWLERRIQPLQHHGDRLMYQITGAKKDSMRVNPNQILVKDYRTLMQYLIKERVRRKFPNAS